MINSEIKIVIKKHIKFQAYIQVFNIEVVVAHGCDCKATDGLDPHFGELREWVKLGN